MSLETDQMVAERYYFSEGYNPKTILDSRFVAERIYGVGVGAIVSLGTGLVLLYLAVQFQNKLPPYLPDVVPGQAYIYGPLDRLTDLLISATILRHPRELLSLIALSGAVVGGEVGGKVIEYFRNHK